MPTDQATDAGVSWDAALDVARVEVRALAGRLQETYPDSNFQKLIKLVRHEE